MEIDEIHFNNDSGQMTACIHWSDGNVSIEPIINLGNIITEHYK